MPQTLNRAERTVERVVVVVICEKRDECETKEETTSEEARRKWR